MIWIILVLYLLGWSLLARPRLIRASERRSTPSRISIVIPARNEEDNIEVLLKSILSAHYQPLEVIVANDSSTDKTKSVAESLSATVIDVPSLPPGWKGKTWACHYTAQSAKGDYILFLDADTSLQASGLAQMENFIQKNPSDVLSLGPFHDVKELYEDLSSVFNLITFMAMKSFGFFGKVDRPAGLFGPCLLIKKESYQMIGGHDSVKDSVIEHFQMHTTLKKNQIPVQCVNGKGIVHYRMYPDGLKSLIDGWSKSFSKGSSIMDSFTLFSIVLWMIGGTSVAIMLSVSFLMSPFSSLVYGIAYFAYAVQFFFMLRMVGSFSVWSSLFYPIQLVAFYVIYFRSSVLNAQGKSMQWKGRDVNST